MYLPGKRVPQLVLPSALARVLWLEAKAHVNLMLTGAVEKIKWLFLSLTCPESHLLTYLFHKTKYGKSSPRKTELVQNRALARAGAQRRRKPVLNSPVLTQLCCITARGRVAQGGATVAFHPWCQALFAG